MAYPLYWTWKQHWEIIFGVDGGEANYPTILPLGMDAASKHLYT